MRKDYHKVADDLADAAEIERVERQWTDVWQQRNQSAADLAAAVASRDESRYMNPHLDRLAGPRPLRILDAGCGMGEWSLALAQQGHEMHAVDISRRTIAILADRFPRIDFQCADVRQLSFADNWFDAVFSWGVFEHFEDGLGQCLSEARRVLRPGGMLFASVPFQNDRHLRRDRKPLEAWDPQFVRGTGYPGAMRFYQWRLTKSEFERELLIAGFEVERIVPIHFEQGLHRMLELDWRLKAGTFGYRAARKILRLLLPTERVSHMLMAIAVKPQGSQPRG